MGRKITTNEYAVKWELINGSAGGLNHVYVDRKEDVKSILCECILEVLPFQVKIISIELINEQIELEVD